MTAVLCCVVWALQPLHSPQLLMAPCNVSQFVENELREVCVTVPGMRPVYHLCSLRASLPLSFLSADCCDLLVVSSITHLALRCCAAGA